jgi:uncharacterized protein YndB with AHSA1/START domain
MKKARAVADVTKGTIIATVEIAAPPERVFRALTDPEELPRWWGQDGLYHTKKHEADLREGGKYRSSGAGADGAEFSVEGEYLEVTPPSRVKQTWRPSWDPSTGNTTVTFQLEPIEGGTRVTVRHEGFTEANAESCKGHANGWERVLNWLSGYAA